MAQAKRNQFAHFINTTPEGESETWTLEGIGVDALSISYNPQVDQYKTIIDEVANSTFNGYQMQSSVSDKRIDINDKMYEFINGIRKNATSVETQMLEVDETGTSPYSALKYDVLIVLNEFLGENATIAYDIYIKGTPTQGTVTIAEGVPTFVATV